MTTILDVQLNEFLAKFETWLDIYLQNRPGAQQLLESQNYSLKSGGKRFRPFLAYLVYRIFSDKTDEVRNFCLALEFVHTYSLIHDDLPCMDNDSFRRGKPTNHKVYGESLALLAGDGLLTDAFSLVADIDAVGAEERLAVIRLLAEKAGSPGMVSGQVMDMQVSGNTNPDHLARMHALKTANLIQAAAAGAALLAGAKKKEYELVSQFSFHLGMAFQIKDDLLDYSEKDEGSKNYVCVLGLESTLSELEFHSGSALNSLASISGDTSHLQELIQYNMTRKS